MDVPVRGLADMSHTGRKKSTTDTAIYHIERVLQDLMRAHPGFQNLGTYDSGQNFHGVKDPTTMHITTRAALKACRLPICQNFRLSGNRSAVTVGFASYDIKDMLDTGMPTARLKEKKEK